MIVEFTSRAWWTTFHGVVLGTGFILALALVLLALSHLRDDLLTDEGAALRLLWLRRGVLLLVLIAWTAVAVGTWVIDPWYHLHQAGSPLFLLDARPKLTFWTDILLEWKERISWTAAVVASGAAYMVVYWGEELLWNGSARRAVTASFAVAFAGSLIAGVIGMLLTKIVPVV